MFILKLTKVLIKLKEEKFDEKKDTKLKTRVKKIKQYFQDELNLTIYHLS